MQVRLLYCSLEEAELIFRAAWASGQAGPSHMWFAVGPALSGLGLEGLPKALFAIRPQGWRDEPRRYLHRSIIWNSRIGQFVSQVNLNTGFQTV